MKSSARKERTKRRKSISIYDVHLALVRMPSGSFWNSNFTSSLQTLSADSPIPMPMAFGDISTPFKSNPLKILVHSSSKCTSLGQGSVVQRDWWGGSKCAYLYLFLYLYLLFVTHTYARSSAPTSVKSHLYSGTGEVVVSVPTGRHPPASAYQSFVWQKNVTYQFYPI